MKRTVILAAVLVLSSLSLWASDPPKLTIDLSGLFVTRTAGASLPFVSTDPNEGAGDVFTTDSAALTAWKAGGDVRLGYAWSKLGAEVRGFLLSKWTNSALYTSDGTSLIIETDPTTSYGIGAGDTMTANNESALKGFEANVTYDLTPTIRLYGGFRYLKVDESFDLLGASDGEPFEDDIWSTTNTMMGGQIGVNFEFLSLAEGATKGFTAQGRAGVALFSNSAHADFEAWMPQIGADVHKLSPAVEAGLQFGYCFTSMIEVHAGYGLLWVGQVAQANRQFSGTTSFNFEDVTVTPVFSGLIAHGAKAGLTIRF
jgi:hypothetical protein